MNIAMIKINGQIDKVLKENENGSATALFKIEPNNKLKNSIVMAEFTKKQWEKIKNSPRDQLVVNVHGEYEIRLMNNKPFIFVKCGTVEKVKKKNQDRQNEKMEALINEEIEVVENRSEHIAEQKSKKKKKLSNIENKSEHIAEQKSKKKKKISNVENINVKWAELVPQDEFIELDINKVKLVEDMHLQAQAMEINIKKANQGKIYPIAVRDIGNGEYGLVAGIKNYIYGKALNKNPKAYVTELGIDNFREKYMAKNESNENDKFEKELDRKFNRRWFELIPEDEFVEIAGSKIKLVEEKHLNSIVNTFNLKQLKMCEKLKPIAVRDIGNGEYGVVTGVRSYIINKLFDKPVKVYITNLDRVAFKQKYILTEVINK